MVTERQVSSGGVAYRRQGARTEVALISVGPKRRWQLPKGLVEPEEPPETTAVREVHEEAGIEAELIAPLETIEYWYQAYRDGQRVRYHKLVHFFLLAYRSGDVAAHDHEVEEARWVEIGEAESLLAFPNERRVVARARELIAGAADA